MFIYRLQKILNLVRFCLQSTDEIQVKIFSLTLCFAQPINVLNERFAYKKI